jgi:hypothetical protein
MQREGKLNFNPLKNRGLNASFSFKITNKIQVFLFKKKLINENV